MKPVGEKEVEVYVEKKKYPRCARGSEVPSKDKCHGHYCIIKSCNIANYYDSPQSKQYKLNAISFSSQFPVPLPTQSSESCRPSPARPILHRMPYHRGTQGEVAKHLCIPRSIDFGLISLHDVIGLLLNTCSLYETSAIDHKGNNI